MSDVSADVPLRDGERVIRSDLVKFWGAAKLAFWPRPAPYYPQPTLPRLCNMVVTDQRLMFEPTFRGLQNQIATRIVSAPLLNVYLVPIFGPPPLNDAQSYELARIDSLDRWHPGFHIGSDAWYFSLRSTPRGMATPDKRDEHLRDVQIAWEAARSRATTHDAQP